MAPEQCRTMLEMTEVKVRSYRCLLFSLFFIVVISLDSGTEGSIRQNGRYSVLIAPGQVVFEVDPRFYSFGMGCSLNWSRKFNLSHPVLRSLVKELAPAYLRLGGTLCDAMTFCEDEDACVTIKNVTLTSTLWDELNTFVKEVGVDLIYDANIWRRTADNTWDPSNFEQILDYSSARGYPLSFELGNEPNQYKHKFNRTLSPEQQAEGLKTLKHILERKRLYQDSLVIGPDTTRVMGNHGLGTDAKEYLRRFLDSIGNTTDVTSSHFYYKNRLRTESILDFLTDPATLDQFVKDAREFRDVVRDHRPSDKQRMWIGESGIFLGAKSVKGISNGFISGMVWLDKLGIAAQNNIEVVVRTSLAACGYHSLISSKYEPYPDYWSAVLYKRLVGTKVLPVETITVSSGGVPATFRMYAHCTNTNRSKYGYQSGAVTIYAVNFDQDDEVQLMFNGMSVDQFLLTPSRAKNITSLFVALNGHELAAQSGGVLPGMPPQPVSSTPILHPWSMGFFVLKNADVEGCR